MVLKHIQIYGVHRSRKCICKSRGWTKKTYFKMYCFKSTLIPTTLYFLSTFLIYIVFLRLLVTADFKRLPEFKIISYYS